MDKLTIFIGVTASAVVLQMLILLGMFLTMRKLGARMQALADKAEETTNAVQTRVLPILDNAKTMQAGGQEFPGNGQAEDRNSHRQCEPHQLNHSRYSRALRRNRK